MAELDSYRITIRYDGLDAEQHELDLYSLGESLQGFARVTGTVAHLALSQEYRRHFRSHTLRVLAKEPVPNCYRIDLIFEFIKQHEILSGSFGTIVAALIPWLYLRATKKGQNGQADELARIAVEAMAAQNKDVTSRLLGLMEQMAVDLKPAMVQSAAPIQISCNTISFVTPQGGLSLDQSDKEALLLPAANQLSDLMDFTVLITELDLERKTCKARFAHETDDRRIFCEINDPLLQTPKNPYSSAMDAGDPITVKAKALFEEFKIKKLYISDVVI